MLYPVITNIHGCGDRGNGTKMEYKKIIAEVGDVIQWNGSCPITNEVLSICDKGAVIKHGYNYRYIQPSQYTVVGTMKTVFWKIRRYTQLDSKRLLLEECK